MIHKDSTYTNSTWLSRTIVISSVIAIALLAIAIFHQQPLLLHYRFNPYNIPMGIAVVANLGVLFLIAKHRHINGSFWLALFLGDIVCFGIGSFIQYMAIRPESVVFWANPASAFGTLTPVLGLMFVISQTRPRLLERTVFPWVTLFAAAFLMVTTMWSTNLFIDSNPAHIEHLSYGLDVPLGPKTWLWYGWLELLIVLMIVLLVLHYRKQTSKRAKRQSLLFLIGTMSIIIGGSIFDLLLPLLGFNDIVPMAVFFSTIQAGFFAYGLIKYDLFVIDPATVAPNILATMAEAVAVTDKSYHILFSNTQAQEMLKTAGLDSVADVAIDTVFQKDEFARLDDRIEHELASGGSVVNEGGIPLIGQQHRFVDISVSNIYDENTIVGLSWVLNDVSDLKTANAQLAQEKANVEQKVVERTKELSLEHARLLASVENLSVGFIMTGQSDSVMLFNKMATHLFGASEPQELQRLLLHDLKLADMITRCKDQRRAINAGEHMYHAKALHIVISPVVDQKTTTVMGVAILLEDVTQQKRLDQERSQFIMTSSHELRTPIAVIEGSLSNANSPAIPSEPDRQRFIDKAYTEARHLGELFKDMETVAALVSKERPVVPESFDITELIQKTVGTFQTRANEKNLKLNVVASQSLTVTADYNNITEALEKLLDNAIKYTSHGSVTITAKPTDTTIIVQITDTGMGIAPADHARLFKQFSRIHSELTREVSGTGLGLYIAQNLIALSGGHIELESMPGQGSTFRFNLPK